MTIAHDPNAYGVPPGDPVKVRECAPSDTFAEILVVAGMPKQFRLGYAAARQQLSDEIERLYANQILLRAEVERLMAALEAAERRIAAINAANFEKEWTVKHAVIRERLIARQSKSALEAT